MPTVKTGSTVRVHCTALRRNGEVIESTAGGDPLRLTIGAGKLMRGFEEALVGMSAGESKKVTIPPDKAYGRRNRVRCPASPGTPPPLSGGAGPRCSTRW